MLAGRGWKELFRRAAKQARFTKFQSGLFGDVAALEKERLHKLSGTGVQCSRSRDLGGQPGAGVHLSNHWWHWVVREHRIAIQPPLSAKHKPACLPACLPAATPPPQHPCRPCMPSQPLSPNLQQPSSSPTLDVQRHARTTKRTGSSTNKPDNKTCGRRTRAVQPKHPTPRITMALPPDAAIFSPSVARLAASTAKDWSYVDAWLAAKYKARPTPPFERNPDTLRVLLALASLNESADENRDLLARVDAGALQDITTATHRTQDEGEDGNGTARLPAFRSGFLAALEDALPRDGSTSLDAMATAALRLGLAYPEPAQLAQAQLALHARASNVSQALARVDVLQRHLDDDSTRLDALLADVGGDAYRPPADLARRNVEMQREVRALSKRLPEMKGQVAALARAVGVPDPTIEQVRREEDTYLVLLDVKRGRDRQVAEFEGLPPDLDQARQQLDSLRSELRSITDRRDAVFENLVERETPRKGR